MKRSVQRLRSGAAVVGCVMVLLAGRASAQRVVVSDIVGTGDEPAAITLLLRSMIQKGPRVAVPLADLRKALEKVPTARALGAANAVDYTQSTPLLKELHDRLISGDLLRDDRLSLNLRVTDKEGHILAATTLQTVRGDVANLAYEAAKRVAKDGGFEVTQVQASLGELRPFARASQQMGRDNNAAARSLEIADPAVVSRVPAVREAADLLKGVVSGHPVNARVRTGAQPPPRRGGRRCDHPDPHRDRRGRAWARALAGGASRDRAPHRRAGRETTRPTSSRAGERRRTSTRPAGTRACRSWTPRVRRRTEPAVRATPPHQVAPGAGFRPGPRLHRRRAAAGRRLPPALVRRLPVARPGRARR